MKFVRKNKSSNDITLYEFAFNKDELVALLAYLERAHQLVSKQDISLTRKRSRLSNIIKEIKNTLYEPKQHNTPRF